MDNTLKGSYLFESAKKINAQSKDLMLELIKFNKDYKKIVKQSKKIKLLTQEIIELCEE